MTGLHIGALFAIITHTGNPIWRLQTGNTNRFHEQRIADDSQMYVYSKPATVGSAEGRLIRCLDNIGLWMKSNRLSLNPSKTQFLRCATTRRLGQLSDAPIEFCDARIIPVTSVRNLGVIVDSSMTFLSHISHVISSCFYQLRQMKSSVKGLPFGTARTIVNCFVISRIDYCNSLLANIPHCHLNRLQRVMNACLLYTSD